jgi:galacturan 1,4-alpha-galacturonidase
MIQSAIFGAVAGLACIANVVAHKWLPVPRPEIKAWPYNPGGAFPVSPHRVKSCYVKASNNGGDDAGSILHAFHTCNNGGTVVLAANYTIASPLDLTFLKHVDVAITGTINFAPDLSYWTEHSFKYAYQDATAFWRFGGEDVNIFGLGVGLINGNGQPWYDAAATNTSLLRPVLFLVDGLQGGSVTGLRMINPPSVSLYGMIDGEGASADWSNSGSTSLPTAQTLLSTTLTCRQWYVGTVIRCSMELANSNNVEQKLESRQEH